MKKYLKMADVFPVEIRTDDESGSLICDEDGVILESFSGDKVADYTLHAINSHDELVQMNQERLAKLEQCAKELTWMIDKHNEQNMEDGSWKYDHQTPWEAMQLVAKAKGGAA